MPPEKRREVLDMCNAAYGQPFDGLFDMLPPDGMHVMGRIDDKLVAHLVITDRWLKIEGGAQLKTAYIDAVATLPEHRRQGYAGELIKRAVALCAQRYDVIGLATDKPELYARYGFAKWKGRQFIEKECAVGTELSPEQNNLMLRVSNMALISDWSKTMTANWRPGGGY